MRTITRRRFLGLGALALPAALGVDARFIEPTALRVTKFKVGSAGNCRFVHFTDFHHKGNASYAAKVVQTPSSRMSAAVRLRSVVSLSATRIVPLKVKGFGEMKNAQFVSSERGP